jgi:hypothetical protein
VEDHVSDDDDALADPFSVVAQNGAAERRIGGPQPIGAVDRRAPRPCAPLLAVDRVGRAKDKAAR